MSPCRQIVASLLGVLLVMLATAAVVVWSTPASAMQIDIECLDERTGERWGYRIEDVLQVSIAPDGHHQVQVIDDSGQIRVIDSGDWQLRCDAAREADAGGS